MWSKLLCILMFVIWYRAFRCVCSAVYRVCASQLEVYGGVCSVEGSLKSGYIVFPVELCT